MFSNIIYTSMRQNGWISGQKLPILGLKHQKSLKNVLESHIYPQILVVVGRQVCFDKILHDPDCFLSFYTPLGNKWVKFGSKIAFLGLKLQKLLKHLLESHIYPQILVVVGRQVCFDKLLHDSDCFLSFYTPLGIKMGQIWVKNRLFGAEAPKIA